MTRRRIAVDARLPWGSGIGRNVANCLPRIARMLPEDDFILHVTRAEIETAAATIAGLPNVTIEQLDISPFSMAEQVKLVRVYAGYDLTWFTNYWVPLAFRHPFVATVYDLLHLEPELFPAGRLKRTLSWLTFRKISRHARALTFISRFSKRCFVERFGQRLPMSIAGIGIDHDGWQPFDPAAAPAKTPQILLVAASKKHKNYDVAIKAFERADIPPHWRLKIVIPGDILRTSVDLAKMSQQNNIDLFVRLSNDALRQLYADSAIVLMPSLYEGFGLPLVEGLQAGAQCISSTAEALVEVGEGADVVFVDPRDVSAWSRAIELECARFDAGGVDPNVTRTNMQSALRYRWDDVAAVTAAMIAGALGRQS